MPGKKLVIQRAAGWQTVESGKRKQWPGLAAAQPFHVKLKVGPKKRNTGKSVKKREENKDE